MGQFESAIWADILALIQATWPEVTGVYRDDLLDRNSWRALLNGGTLVPPFALVGLSQSEGEDWGIDNEAYRLPVTVSYVVRRDDSRSAVTGGFDVQTLLLNQLQTLREALIAHEGAFQLAGDPPELSLDESNPDPLLLRKEGLPLAVGLLKFRALVGQSFGP